MTDRSSGAPRGELRGKARSLLEQAARFEPPTPAALAAEARASAGRAARFEPPPRDARLQRFGYGLALPFALARATLRDPAARRRYLRVASVQVALTLGLGVLITLLWSDLADDLREAHPNVHVRFVAAAGLLSALYATISGVEWAAIALSRDYHDGVSRDASLLTGLDPEEEEKRPRVRVDFQWMRKRVRDKVRGALVFASVVPFLGVVSWIAGVGPYLSAALLTLWGVYWAGVFAASRTIHGWKDEARAPDPIFLRGLDRATRALPGAVSWAPATYGRVVRWSTRSLFAPAARLEALPWELTGLALARVLRHVPGLYAALRPFYSVAAAHMIVAHDRAAAAEAAQRIALEREADARIRISVPAKSEEAEADAERDNAERDNAERRERSR